MTTVRRRQEKARRGPWQRLLRWVLFTVCFLLLVCVLLVLLAEPIVNSSFVKGRMLSELDRRSGLSWSVDKVELDLPWRASLTGLSAAQPSQFSERITEPVFKVDTVALTVQRHPNRPILWPRTLELTSPRGKIPIQVVAELLRNPHVKWKEPPVTKPAPSPGPKIVPPSVEKPEPQKQTEASTPSDQTDPPEVENKEEAKTTDIPNNAALPPQPPRKAEVQTNPEPKPEPQRPPIGPRFDLVVRDGDFELVNGTDGKSFGRLKGLSVDLPLGGVDRLGEISWEQTQALGSPMPGKGEVELKWERPWLKLVERNGELLGVQYQVAAELSPFNRGVFRGQIQVPDQSVSLPEFGIEMSSLQGRIASGGVVRNRSSWNGQGAFFLRDLTVTDPRNGEKLTFYEGQARFIGNAFSAALQDGELLGESVMLRANGLAARNGGIGAALRLFTGPEETAVINGRANRFFPDIEGPWMQASPTPDLAMRDIRLAGTISQLWVNAESDRKWMPVSELIARLRGETGAATEAPAP